MSLYVYDTNIIISYGPPNNLRGLLFSAVVLHELAAGANDDSELQLTERTCIEADKANKLLTPTMMDWWEAGKALYRLRQGKKSKAKGKTPKMSVKEVQRIMRDVMIARTAKRANATLVTDNIKDFELIKRFCNVKLISCADFFGH
jgi:predicted nucleic acid-binding protein